MAARGLTANLPAAALDALAERGVRLRARGDRLEVQVPPAAESPRLDAWLARHRDELICLACQRCGAVPFTAYTAAGEQRCQACVPNRCRHCHREIPAGTTSCVECAASPLVRRALALGATEAVP